MELLPIVQERERMARMKEVVLTAEQILTTIGKLTAIRVKCDTLNKDIRESRVYPLNQSQISKFTESLLVKQHHNGQITLWDLYNSATDLYKADAMEIPNLLPQNRAMVSFLEEQFAV